MSSRMPPNSDGFNRRQNRTAKSKQTRQKRDADSLFAQSDRRTELGQKTTEFPARPKAEPPPNVLYLKEFRSEMGLNSSLEESKGRGSYGPKQRQEFPASSKNNGKRQRRQAASGPESLSERGLKGQLAQQARLLIVWIILMLGGLGLAVNLYRLQIVQATALQERATEQRTVSQIPMVPRRPIVDRNGNILAMDRPVYTLYAHPQMFKESPDQIAAKLATILDRPAASLEYQFKTAPSGIRIADLLSQEVGDRISELYTDGLELTPDFSRLYPYQDIAANVVGYVDVDHQAQAGIEYSQHNILEGFIPGQLTAANNAVDSSSVSSSGGFVPSDELRLQLTIDTRLQLAARSALLEHMQAYNAKRGTVLVMDARDGSMMALVQEPSYNPNEYYKFDVERFKNWALTDLYEPGSTFKPIAVAIALESGAVQADSVFNDEGQVYVDGWPIANADYEYAGGRGSLTLTEIVQYSSNVGMVHVAAQMQPEVFYSWLERLGLGQVVDIDLPFAIASHIKSQEEFTASPVNAATTAFGQGFALTPIQMLQLYGSLANGGKLVTPHVVLGLFNSNGQSYWQPQMLPPRQVFSPKTTKTVLSMMEKVVTDGTGKAAKIPGYRVAGKTGTAQKANGGGGYSDYAKIVSFAGVFPADDPRYVILAVIDEPQGGSGGVVAAPIVKSVIETLIVSEGIPPVEGNR